MWLATFQMNWTKSILNFQVEPHGMSNGVRTSGRVWFLIPGGQAPYEGDDLIIFRQITPIRVQFYENYLIERHLQHERPVIFLIQQAVRGDRMVHSRRWAIECELPWKRQTPWTHEEKNKAGWAEYKNPTYKRIDQQQIPASGCFCGH